MVAHYSPWMSSTHMFKSSRNDVRCGKHWQRHSRSSLPPAPSSGRNRRPASNIIHLPHQKSRVINNQIYNHCFAITRYRIFIYNITQKWNIFKCAYRYRRSFWFEKEPQFPMTVRRRCPSHIDPRLHNHHQPTHDVFIQRIAQKNIEKKIIIIH